MKVGDARTFIYNIPDNLRLETQAKGEVLDSSGVDAVLEIMVARVRENGSHGLKSVPSNDPDMPKAVELACADVLRKTGVVMHEIAPTHLKAPSGWGFWVRCATLPEPGTPEFAEARKGSGTEPVATYDWAYRANGGSRGCER